MGIEGFFQWSNNIQKKEFSLKNESTNSEYKILLTKEGKGLSFELGFPDYKLFYDNNSELLLTDDFYKIRINKYIEAYTESLFKRKCTAYIFESIEFNHLGEFYHKYYSKIDGDLAWFSFLEGNVDKTVIELDGKIYKLSIYFDHSLKNRYLIIENQNKLSFINFKHVVNNIIVSIGFLSGYYYRLEEFYFQSDDNTFQKHIDFFYRGSDQKSTIYEPFTQSPSSYLRNKDGDELIRYQSCLSTEGFGDLVKLLITKTEIYSALLNLFKIYKGYPLFTLSMLFVILETICEQINKEYNSEWQDKVLVKEKGFHILEKIKDQISENDYYELIDVVNQIDSKLVENIVNFERACKGVGAKLSNEERKILKKRNDLFHGRIIPVIVNVNSEEDYNQIEKDYAFYSDRIYVLISKLILKRINFFGYILNHPKIREKETGRSLSENYFIKI